MHARPERPGGPTGGGGNIQTPNDGGTVCAGSRVNPTTCTKNATFALVKSNLNPRPLTPDRQGNFSACSAATRKC